MARESEPGQAAGAADQPTTNAIPPYTVVAHNTAPDSENKIHDDTVARRFGFAGGLVPGVDVYAYMTHPAVARWGRAWLERGTLECRFLKPVYDGAEVVVLADETPDGLTISVRSGKQVCATGRATLPQRAFPHGAVRDPPFPPEARPVADETSLVPGRLLGMRPLVMTADYLTRYYQDVRETEPLYARESLAHPGLVLRTCNWALTHNVVLGPWMHVGSTVRHLRVARAGEELSVHARVSANYEHKGHRFVELDALVLASDRPVARVDHVAIYRPRQAAEAGV